MCARVCVCVCAQERSVEEASRALQGKGLVGTKLVDLSDHLQQAAAP